MPAVVCEVASWQAVCARLGEVHPERCPVCGQEVVCTGAVVRRVGPGPPPASMGRAACGVGREGGGGETPEVRLALRERRER